MPAPRINFSNLNDGVDWESALPPHIVAQQERLRALHQPPPPRTLFNAWPLSEESFPPPPTALRGRLRPSCHGRGAVAAFHQHVTAHFREMENMAAHLSSALRVPPTLRAMEVCAPMRATQLEVTVRSDHSGGPPRVTIVRTEWSRPAGRRHIARSGPNVDVLTGAVRAPPRVPVAVVDGAAHTRRHVGSAPVGGEWEINDMSYENLLRLDDGAGRGGLSQQELSRIRPKIFCGRPEMCTVCLEEMRGGAKILDGHCGHKFHEKCIKNWLAEKNSCPTCRREVPFTRGK